MKQLNLEQTKWLLRGLIIVIILVAVYVIIAFFPFTLEQSKRLDHMSTSAPAHVNTVSSPGANYITTEKMEAFISSLQEVNPGHDPFLSSGEQEWKKFLSDLKERPPHLKGILQIEGKKIALIQSSRFQEGEEVNGFRIEKIEDKSALLSKEGKTYTITLTDYGQ
jgi:hypothetical protein